MRTGRVKRGKLHSGGSQGSIFPDFQSHFPPLQRSHTFKLLLFFYSRMLSMIPHLPIQLPNYQLSFKPKFKDNFLFEFFHHTDKCHSFPIFLQYFIFPQCQLLRLDLLVHLAIFFLKNQSTNQSINQCLY